MFHFRTVVNAIYLRKDKKGIAVRKSFNFLVLFIFIVCGHLFANTLAKQFTTSSLKAIMGAPNNPKVEIAWNRYYDHKEIGEICKRLAQAPPSLLHFGSIGKSVQGRDLWLMTVTNFKKGEPDRKPGMYIDGNIHSNEIQGAEVALYTAWYLVENYGKVDWITELLDDKIFYIIPTINPDARDFFIHKPNTPHSPRSGMMPRDDDGDGLVDEDGFDDLDHDGNIVMMRRKNPNGRWKADPDDPRLMVRAKPDEKGQYELLGWEGFDNDGDGRVNEDGPGFYDPNRNWAWNWAPSYVQYGGDQYPFSIPEDRAVADFVMAHKNICGAQTYHNAGGIILRGPGAKNDSSYNRRDIQVYDVLAKTGEEILPGYEYQVVNEDMYTVYGGELDWLYGARGIFTFTNELWTSFNYFRKPKKENAGYFGSQKDTYRFDRLLLFREGIVPWKTVNHPQYGKIEIGGVKKSWTRMPPSFMIEDMCHRNMAFTLYHAYQLPQISIDSVSVKKITRNLHQVDVVIKNDRIIPTRSFHEVRHKFTRPDYVSLSGKKAKIVAGFIVDNPLLDRVREQKYQPQKLKVDTISGLGTVQVRWLVDGKPPFQIVMDSDKGGMIRKEIE